MSSTAQTMGLKYFSVLFYYWIIIIFLCRQLCLDLFIQSTKTGSVCGSRTCNTICSNYKPRMVRFERYRWISNIHERNYKYRQLSKTNKRENILHASLFLEDCTYQIVALIKSPWWKMLCYLCLYNKKNRQIALFNSLLWVNEIIRYHLSIVLW